MGGKLKQFICVLAVALCGHAQILSVPFTTSIAGGGEPVTVQFSCTTTITAGTGAGATNATNNIDCDTGGIGGIAANIFVAGNSACTNGALGGACSGPSAPTVTDRHRDPYCVFCASIQSNIVWYSCRQSNLLPRFRFICRRSLYDFRLRGLLVLCNGGSGIQHLSGDTGNRRYSSRSDNGQLSAFDIIRYAR